jgi:UDP-N-acetylglucosamine 3-dehydrogenase
MAKIVKVGAIGCGAIAERLHVPDYAACEQAKIVGFADADISRAKALAAKFAPEAKVYADYKQMLKDGEVEAVSVCLPNVLHAPVTIDALQAGCNVMVEKPMATSLEEAKKMVEAAKKAGKLLMVNQTQRRELTHRKAKEVIDSGIMGKILHVTAMFGHSGPEDWSPSGKWFFKKNQARFGAMADLGVHKADLVRYLTGKEVAEINAFYGCLEKKRADVDDNFVASLRFEDGTLGTLAASWTVKEMDANYTILHCSNGSLAIYMYPGKPLVAHLANPKCEIVFDIPPVPPTDGSGWGVDVGGAFVRAILGLEPPFCTGEEGMKSLEVILAAEKACDTRKTVKLR